MTDMFTAPIFFCGIILATPTPLCFAAQAGQTTSPSTATSTPAIETVRSAYLEGRDKDVLILVERALIDATTVGDIGMKAAELYFWKGSSLRRLGRYDESLIALEHAKKLGFAGPELYIERGLTNKSLGHAEEAQQDYQEAEKRFPDDPDQRELYLKHWKWDGADQPRFQLWFAPQAGWDSNVIGLDQNTPLLQNAVNFQSYYAGFYVDTKYFVVQNQHQLLWLEYQLLGRDYPQEQSVSFLDNLISLIGRQPLLDGLDLEIRGSWEEAFLSGTGHFRTQRTIGPAFLVQPLADVQIRVWGDWTDATYYESVPSAQNRDGSISRIGLNLSIDLGHSWMLGPYGVYNKENAQGSDYVAHGWEFGVQASTPELTGFKIVGLVSYGEEMYPNPNSLTGFTANRIDRPLGVTLTVTFKQIEKWLGYAPAVSVGYVRHSSTISNFNYTRWTPQLELSLGVLSF
jgi:tetratricopeptide (TPR) repeat protein